MKLSDKAGIPEQVMARQLGEETVILDLGSGTYFGLEEAGSRIWQLLTEGKTLGEVCDAVLEEYDVEREVLECDVLELTQQLRRQGLLTIDRQSPL
jgi:hypothetical protein